MKGVLYSCSELHIKWIFKESVQAIELQTPKIFTKISSIGRPSLEQVLKGLFLKKWKSLILQGH